MFATDSPKRPRKAQARLCSLPSVSWIAGSYRVRPNRTDGAAVANIDVALRDRLRFLLQMLRAVAGGRNGGMYACEDAKVRI